MFEPFDCVTAENKNVPFVYQLHIYGNPLFLRIKESYLIDGKMYYRIPDSIRFSEDVFREVEGGEFYVHGQYDYPAGYGVYEGEEGELNKMLSSLTNSLNDCSRRRNMLKEYARLSLADYYGDYYVASTKKSKTTSFNDMVKSVRLRKEQSRYGLTHEDYMRDKEEFINGHWDEVQSDWYEEHDVDGWASKKCERIWYGNKTFYHYIFAEPYYEKSYYGQDVQKGWKLTHEWFSYDKPYSSFYTEIVA